MTVTRSSTVSSAIARSEELAALLTARLGLEPELAARWTGDRDPVLREAGLAPGDALPAGGPGLLIQELDPAAELPASGTGICISDAALCPAGTGICISDAALGAAEDGDPRSDLPVHVDAER